MKNNNLVIIAISTLLSISLPVPYSKAPPPENQSLLNYLRMDDERNNKKRK